MITASRRAAALLLVGAALALGRSGLLGQFGIGEPAQISLSILLVAAVLWVSEAIPLFATSFVVLLLSLVWLVPAAARHDLQLDGALLLAPFFSDVILLFLGGFTLSAALHKYRLDERLAQLVIGRVGGATRRLTLAIMAVTALLSMWLSNTATAAMMLAMCLPIARQLPATGGQRKALLLAVPLAANVGGLGTPIGSPPNAIAMQYIRAAELELTFGLWMLAGVPGVVVMLAVIWAVLMLLYRGPSLRLSLADAREPFPFTPARCCVVVVAALTIMGWMTSAWHGFSAGVVAIVPVVALFGSRLLTAEDLRQLSWDVLLMMGGGLCLGAGVAASGLADWIVSQLPVHQADLLTVVIAFSVVATAMSSVMSNTAAANVIMPLAIGMAAEVQAPLLLAVAFACSLAMPLPISTPPNAMAFSSGELTAADLVKPGTIVTLAGLLLALTTGYWWWDLVGIF